jgi:hypothetical protein
MNVTDFQKTLNRLAGTTGLDAQGAANVWAGTTGLDLLGALNAKAGTTGLELNGVCRRLATTYAGSPELDYNESLDTATSSSFNPITGVGWTAAYWAEGSEFVALGTAADAAVAAIPDEKASFDLAQGTGSAQPLYRTTAGPNSTPAWDAVSADIILKASTPAIAQPFSMVAVAKSDLASGDRVLVCGDSSIGQIYETGDQWSIYAGSAEVKAGTTDTSAHLFVGFFSGASSKLDIDGTQVISGNPGTTGLAGFHIFGGASGSWDGKCSFAACASGDIRNDAGWAGFKTWVTSHYGITIP